jgi:hypothetical protein
MATLATDAGQAIAFLRHLFKPYSDGFIEIRPLSKHNPVHANRTTYRLPHCLKGEEGQALTQHIISLAIRGYDVYVGVCPRAAPEGPGRKLGKDSIEYVGAVWIDLDSKVPGSSQGLLDNCDIVVHTGNGWHGYVMLPAVANCRNTKDRTAIESKIRSWQNSIILGTDPVGNVDRILRVPGTINWKDVDNPKAVTLLKGGAMRPIHKVSLLVRHLEDARLDALLASAKQGQLGRAVPRIRHASGRITDLLDVFFLEAEEACMAFESNPAWEYRLNIVRADLPEIMEYYFGS